jgi:hypothetical protein
MRSALEELWQDYQDSELDSDMIADACCHVEAALEELLSVMKLM